MKMKKKAIKCLSFALALFFLLSVMSGRALAAETVASGECGNEGDNLTWTLDNDGVLTITGTGKMYYDNYYDHEGGYYDPDVGGNPDEMPNPWLDYSLDVKRVILPEGLEDISDMAFTGFENLTEINIPASVTDIGIAAFMLTGLTNVVLPEGLSLLDEGVFSECTSLESIYIPSSVTFIGQWAFNNCSALTDIYFGGDRSAWDSIENWDNDFSNITVHFNSMPPAEPVEPTEPAEPVEPADPQEPVKPDSTEEQGPYTFDPDSFAAAASWNVRVTVDGITLIWKADGPYIDENDRTMANYREIGEALNLNTVWDSNTGEASFSDGKSTIYFPIGSTRARTGNGNVLEMDTTAAIYEDQPYVPIRYVAEYFGRNVNWDLSTRIVSIN